jgi:hypothetical protein
VYADGPWITTPDAVIATTHGRSGRQWLEWALTFAQEDLSYLSTQEWRARATTLAAFLCVHGHGLSSSAEAAGEPLQTRLPSVEEVRDAQHDMAQILRSFAAGKPLDVLKYQVRVTIGLYDGIPKLFRDEHQRYDLAVPAEACLAFAQLLSRVAVDIMDKNEGEAAGMLRQCPAPAPRQQAPCGTWFIGRPNRQYCSPLCQNRAGTRRARQPKRSAKRRRGAQAQATASAEGGEGC